MRDRSRNLFSSVVDRSRHEHRLTSAHAVGAELTAYAAATKSRKQVLKSLNFKGKNGREIERLMDQIDDLTGEEKKVAKAELFEQMLILESQKDKPSNRSLRKNLGL